MNPDDLERLVARARATEDTPTPPPPGLLDRARRSAQRRRRLVTAGAAAATAVVVLATGVVLRPFADDTPDPTTVAGARDPGELARHGGPCPEVLPTPTDDDGYGFGTSTAATAEPRYAEPDVAWICQYQTRDVAPPGADGASYEWVRLDAPRRLGDADAAQVAEVLGGLGVPTSAEYACRADLGPRWLLVTSEGGDLTGTTVDDFGCGHVRLTGDPFSAAPGDRQDDGTPSGFLTSPPGLVPTLRDWWDTSPADTGTTGPPAELRVTCTDQGPRVSTRTVAAQNGGVVVVADSQRRDGTYLTYQSAGDGPTGGDPARGTTTYAFPPGELTLDCATPPEMDPTGAVTVEVVDPDGYWRDATLPDYGCGGSSGLMSWTADLVGTGRTAQQAIDGLLATLGPGHTAEAAEIGYSGDPRQTWVVAEDGSPALSAFVTRERTGYTASPDVRCR